MCILVGGVVTNLDHAEVIEILSRLIHEGELVDLPVLFRASAHAPPRLDRRAEVVAAIYSRAP
mgnify:CR=1 FL=1